MEVSETQREGAVGGTERLVHIFQAFYGLRTVRITKGFKQQVTVSDLIWENCSACLAESESEGTIASVCSLRFSVAVENKE